MSGGTDVLSPNAAGTFYAEYVTGSEWKAALEVCFGSKKLLSLMVILLPLTPQDEDAFVFLDFWSFLLVAQN